MTTVVHAHRPGRKALSHMIAAEWRMVVRDTAGLVVPFGLPLLILLTSALSAGDVVIVNGRTALDLFVLPLVIVMVTAMIGIINMPSFLAYYRRSGVLRRLAVTPASPMIVLIAQVLVSVAQALLGIAAALVVAMLAFGANPPIDIVGALGVLLLTIAAMYSVGMVVAAVAPTPNSAVAIGLLLFFALGALGGMFGGRDVLPGPLAELGGWLPFGAAVDALAATWAGMPLEIGPLVSLGVTVIVGSAVAGLFFRWE